MEEVCEVTSSKRIYANELVQVGVPFLKSKEIIEKVNGQANKNLLHISEQRFLQITEQTGSIKAGDVLLTSRGTLGIPYVVTSTDRFHFADGNLTWFRRFKGLESVYLKYFLLSPTGKAELAKCVIGSSQQAYTIAALKKVEIPLAPLPVQQRIAGILTAYDELIENSQRRIKILEAMARGLYREWFVHFRFPGHDNHPRVASALGEIPQGWEVKKLGDFIQFKSGFAFKSATFTADGEHRLVTIKNVQDGSFNPESDSRMDSLPERLPSYCVLEDGDILLSLTGNVGRVCLVFDGPYLLNQRVAKLVPFTSGDRSLAYCMFRDSEMRTKLEMLSNGVAQQNLSPVLASQMEFICPPKELREQFANFAEPLLKSIVGHYKKTQNLRRTRDLLLPRLLSGQIEVEAA
jgi:type I restriction enzyme S subunit